MTNDIEELNLSIRNHEENGRDGYVENIRFSFIDIPSQISLVIFFRGCSIKCKDCQNCHLQTKDETKKVNIDYVMKYIDGKKLNNWICFQGGEPFDQPLFLYNIIKRLNKKVCIFTGYEFRIIKSKYKNILDLTNVIMIKAGKFILQKRIYNKFLATTNQKLFFKINNKFEEFDWIQDTNNKNIIDKIKSI